MTNCNYCGTGILFGGKREGNLRFCNERCRQAGLLVAASRQIPDAQVQEFVWKVHQGRCPKCGGSGPIDVHTGYRVWSAVLLTQWSSSGQISCRPCGMKKQFADAGFSLLLGWWGFPWGLIMTPIQVGRNLAKVASPPEFAKPSEQLERALRINLVKQLAAKQPSPSQVAAPK
jgi:hypothetical protein